MLNSLPCFAEKSVGELWREQLKPNEYKEVLSKTITSYVCGIHAAIASKGASLDSLSDCISAYDKLEYYTNKIDPKLSKGKYSNSSRALEFIDKLRDPQLLGQMLDIQCPGYVNDLRWLAKEGGVFNEETKAMRSYLSLCESKVISRLNATLNQKLEEN